mgnify:FL=1
MELIIPAVIIVLIMFIFTFFMFKNLVKRINDSTKKYFLDKLQDFDYIIAEKEKEIEILSEQIKRLNEAKQQGENGEIVEIPETKKPEEKIVYDIPTPEFREAGFFKNYKGLNKEFDVDEEKILKDFIKVHEKDDTTEYKELSAFSKLFTQNAIYESLTLTPEEQLVLVESLLNEKNKKYVEPIVKTIKNFNVLEMLDKIKERMDKISPTIYVYVGGDNKNYDYLSSKVKTKLFKNMSKGIIIEYKDKLYDYSI